MLKLLVGALGFVAGLVLSGFVFAVSMGGINVVTALGEPLRAEIELEAASKAEADSVSARLATPDMFKAAGLDYPYGLPQLKFQAKTRADNGEPYLTITSTQPINEPFVTLLVELSWSSGRLLREYTFLLDPPGYAAAQLKDEEVSPLEPGVLAAPGLEPQGFELQGEQVMGTPEPAGASSTVDEEVSVVATPAPSQKFTIAAAPTNIASGVIKVKRGDTLSKLANQAMPADVSLERMLVALYRANADAFSGKNMNRLKAGKILRVPEQSELDDLAQAEAVTEIRAQAADWHAYRQKLAAARVPAAEETARREVSGKISTSVADKAPAAKESAKEVVRLSKGEAPGDKAVPDKLHAVAEEAIARNKALQESNERVALLEKNIKAMQRLADLKAQVQAGSGQAEGAAAGKAESAKLEAVPQVLTPPVAASPVQPAKPATKLKVAPQPSLLDEMLDQPLYLAGGAAVLLVLGGLGFALIRRRGGKKARDHGEPEKDVGSASGRIAVPVMPSPETGDFTSTAIMPAGVSPAPTDEVDPISEADLFLTFGRDEQAEEILKEALHKNPDYHQIHLKLLSIYANRKDVNAFSVIARQLQDSGDAAAWEQAVMLGRKLEPNNPMYGGTASAGQAAVIGAVPDLGKAKEQPSALDFDLGFGAPKTAAAGAGESMASTVVLNAPMDFDVTVSHPSLPAQSPEQAEAPAMNLEDLIFDVTASHAPISAATQERTATVAPPDADGGPAFMLDFPSADKFVAAPRKVVAKETRDIGLGEINLNLESSATPALPVEDETTRHEDIATKLDLARAYQEMGDAAGAREILQEVVREGDKQQREAAQALLQQIP